MRIKSKRNRGESGRKQERKQEEKTERKSGRKPERKIERKSGRKWPAYLAVCLVWIVALTVSFHGRAFGEEASEETSEETSEEVGEETSEEAGEETNEETGEEVGEKTVATGPASLIYDSPVFLGDGEEFRPEEEREQMGKTYRLVSAELVRKEKEGGSRYVESHISIPLEGDLGAPGTADILVLDEATGTEYEREVPLIEEVERKRYWSDDFRFPVTVTQYDAERFYLGETEMIGTERLADYGDEFLKYLNLDPEYYRVEEIDWSGEPYEREGVLCRDAEASGKKLLREVDARYGGKVKLPPIMGRSYHCVYEEVMEEETAETEGTLQTEDTAARPETFASAEEPPPDLEEASETLAQRARRWLVRYLTVIRFGAAFLIGVFLAVFLLSRAGKAGKSKKQRNRKN